MTVTTIKIFANKRVMVTGGAGFIGSELVRQLIELGASVSVADNLVNGKRENLANLPADSMQLHVVDIRDRGGMAKLLTGVDIVFHLACLGVRHSIHAPLENQEVNGTATLHLLESAFTAGVSRFVYISSSEVYGTARSVPMDEMHPTLPMTVYGASKLAGEAYTRAYYTTYNFPTVVIRPFNSYGPRCHHEGDSGEVIPKFLLRAMADKPLMIFGDGNQTRDFTFVSDTARGIIELGCAEESLGKTFNLGSGKEISINELSQHISLITGKQSVPVEYLPDRPGDVLRLYANSNLAQEAVGFTPRISLDQGLYLLMDWYNEQGTDAQALLAEEQICNWKGRQKENDVS